MKQNYVNNNQHKEGWVLSSLNMAPIYSRIISIYKNDPDSCPTIYVVEDLPENQTYFKCSDILVLKRSVLPDATMKTDNYLYREDLHFGSFRDSSFDVYTAALTACNRMKIMCPQIMPSDSLGSFRGMALQDMFNITRILHLRNGMSLLETFEVLFHELRHAWQHEKHHNKYYDNYKFLTSGIDLKSYMMQPAEIDAEAFSVRMMVDMGLETYPVKRWDYEDLNKMIEAKAKRMCFPNPMSGEIGKFKYIPAAI